jgi:hypothetical protein
MNDCCKKLRLDTVKKLLKFHQTAGQYMEQSHEVQRQGFYMWRKMTSRKMMTLMLLSELLTVYKKWRSDTVISSPQPTNSTVKNGFQMAGDSITSLRLTISRNGA